MAYKSWLSLGIWGNVHIASMIKPPIKLERVPEVASERTSFNLGVLLVFFIVCRDEPD
jgi:hypothetical protein